MLLHNPSVAPPRRGVVLLAVLVVIVVLSLAAYKYNEYTLAEYRAIDSSVRAGQSRAFALSGVNYTAAMLLDVTDNLSGNPWNNPSLFQHITVPTTAKNAKPGYFTVLSLLSPDALATSGGAQAYQLGVTDEAGKINLNALLALDKGAGNIGMNMLMQLPNMTQDVANAILDWMDPDDTPRASGAESDYYSSLNPPYQCKNGPLDSLEELLLVKGVTPQLLFGNDRNHNGVLDPGEDDGTGQVDQGWSAYLTVYSREPNVDSTGNGRIYINDPDLNTLNQTLTTAVGSDLANYIIAYRMYGGSTVANTPGKSGGGSTMSASDRTAVNSTIQSGRSGGGAPSSGSGSSKGGASGGKQKLTNISSLWALVNSQVSITTGSGRSAKTVKYPSPLNNPSQQAQLLPTLLDTCTTSKSSDLTARINVNTASQTVLTALQQAVPALQTADIQTIMGARPQPTDSTAPDPIFNTPAWLLTKANLPVATVQALDKYITARSGVYRFQSIGYFEKGGPVSRIEAVVDTFENRPRIVYLRDITELGRAFDMSALTGNNSN